jgi:Cu(I)/Ag(I) efflux system membrane protein CusA/SilA
MGLGGMNPMPPAMSGLPVPAAPGAAAPAAERAFVPLGQLADIRIAGGPPMVRDEAGLLVGYVYVDIDQGKRDIGGYVDEAKAVVSAAVTRGALTLPQGFYLKWTGQYEQLEQMVARMKVVVPVTLGIIVLLLFLQFRNFVEVLIVLLSLPFALVGSVWLLWLLDYRLSTAVWVGIIALVGLAAQTGIVMIVYIDNAYLRRKRAGEIHTLADIVAAHMEGTVQRVRPKLMTVATMLIGLVPLLWATTSGADVMKRIAAPMVGGLITSAFLTLELIPVVSTYWRQEQLLWERLAERDSSLLPPLKRWSALVGAGAVLLVAALLSRLYVTLPGPAFTVAVLAGALMFLAGTALYLRGRPAARRVVWPTA